MTAQLFSSWTIFMNPSDFPNGFLARRFEIRAGKVTPTTSTLTGVTLDDVRDQLHNEWPELIRLPRSPEDHPTVVETWL